MKKVRQVPSAFTDIWRMQDMRKCAQAIAENLNERFGTKFTAHNLVMTVGAAGRA